MSSEITHALKLAANHELFVELMNRSEYRAAAAMFIEVAYRARYPLNFPAILSGMNDPELESAVLAKYESESESLNRKWNEELAVYKLDMQFMWSLTSFKDAAHESADRLKQGLMQNSMDADAGGMRYLRGVMAYCVAREAARSKKAEEFFRDVVGDFESLRVEPDRPQLAGTFNAAAIGVWYVGE